MGKRVEIIEQREIFNRAIFRVIEARLKYERYDGMLSSEIVRLNIDRGDSVAALVHDTDADVIILTEQFRYPTRENGPGWMIEIPAGMVGKEESPSDTLARELLEEVGYITGPLEPIRTFYVSPGGTSERIHLFYVVVNRLSRTRNGGGMENEGEDIRVIRYPVSDALDDLVQGKILDAKTIIALQWLALNRDSLTKLS